VRVGVEVDVGGAGVVVFLDRGIVSPWKGVKYGPWHRRYSASAFPRPSIQARASRESTNP
jgi:hypothetical protein